ncbi:MAG: hypothetical protein KOO62_04220 [candidate division Zixibacteria bacterium]|nr:hypothetical protein [candidate division Zixibacteria bacterium]
MFCPECKCEFIGWKAKCPACKTPLVEKFLPRYQPQGKTIAYDDLVALVREAGGRLDIELTATEVGKARKFRFPYVGYGFAWAKRMAGNKNDMSIELWTSEVGTDRSWSFFYFGHGFAWARRMQGYVGGNEIDLVVTEVAREKKWHFPFRGYGYAWTMEMSGECGERLRAKFVTTKTGRERDYGFPYQGYGYAWADKAVVALTLVG